MRISNIEDILQHPTGRKLMQRLTPKQRFVIELRYGFKDGFRYTHREIAVIMGHKDHKSVWEHEQAALKKLRRYAFDPYAPRHTPTRTPHNGMSSEPSDDSTSRESALQTAGEGAKAYG